MITVHRYITMPGFLNVLRSRANAKGKQAIKLYEDDKNRQVGFSDGEDLYVIDVVAVRDYYFALYAGMQGLKSEAELYARDVMEIVGPKRTKKNKKTN